MKKSTTRPVPIINVSVLLVMAGLIIAAIRPWAAWDAGRQPDVYGWNLFSYFTVDSNLIAAVVFVLAAVAILRKKPFGAWFRYLRGGAVLYMIITGIVYALLLQNNPDANPTLGFDWKNFVLHQLGPIFILAWWLLWPSSKAISPREALWWLVFPAIWIVYILARASVTGWYPYPFLNPDKVGGWGGVLLYTVGITLAFIALSQLLAWISRERRRNTSLY